MQLNSRIQIKSLHTNNSVFRTIETQEQLEKYRDLEGYDVTVMPNIHSFSDSSCVACEG
jgi:hypothetical protein